jgi:hypothetical protein
MVDKEECLCKHPIIQALINDAFSKAIRLENNFVVKRELEQLIMQF